VFAVSKQNLTINFPNVRVAAEPVPKMHQMQLDGVNSPHGYVTLASTLPFLLDVQFRLVEDRIIGRGSAALKRFEAVAPYRLREALGTTVKRFCHLGETFLAQIGREAKLD
jgi:hypothetical protein